MNYAVYCQCYAADWLSEWLDWLPAYRDRRSDLHSGWTLEEVGSAIDWSHAAFCYSGTKLRCLLVTMSTDLYPEYYFRPSLQRVLFMKVSGFRQQSWHYTKWYRSPRTWMSTIIFVRSFTVSNVNIMQWLHTGRSWIDYRNTGIGEGPQLVVRFWIVVVTVPHFSTFGVSGHIINRSLLFEKWPMAWFPEIAVRLS